MAVTVIETRVYRAYFDTGEFDPYAANKGDAMPMFGCTVLAESVHEALAKITEAFPLETVTSIHTEGETLVGHKVEHTKVVY